jgi:hypothetical protein
MKLIKINTNHYVVVDDSEIREKSGDWFYSFETGKIYDTLIHHTAISCKKITHSTQPLDTIILKNRDHSQSVGHYYGDGGQLSLQEVKELIGEVDVEKKANDCIAKVKHNGSYIRGYNQALEDNKEKKYTEEDVISIVEKSRETGLTAEYLMLTLQPKTEWEVEIVDGKLKLKL